MCIILYVSINVIKKSNISDEVYRQIIDNISSGEWKPASKLPSENDLAAMLGVSRVSVRNAIQRLVGQGILVSKHGGGTFVSELNPSRLIEGIKPLLVVHRDDIIDLYEFRRILETGNIRLLSEVYNDDIEKRLIDNYEQMKQAKEDLRSFVKLDADFHYIIAESTGNSIIASLYDAIRESIFPKQLIVQTEFGTRGGLKYHGLILDALRARDFKAAEDYMDEHMRMTILNVRSGKQNISEN